MSAATSRKKGTKLISALPAEPEVLKVVGEESERNGTSKLSSRQIDQIIKAVRSQKTKR
jgi:hypothetical protein